ncbi:hypothetical protein JCM10212_000943 [Sporobolomyces blumeae]
MAPKRPQDGATSGADKKRQRVREQRSIPVQGYPPRAGGSGPSGNSNLPPTLEVEKFAQARSFEISAMQRAMKSAKEAGTQRAFQSLPRELRRRAASHNIRRLPLRLRQRARAEVPKDAAKPKKVSRKMLGRHRRVRPGLKAEMFRKRQRDKLWLDTHVWHAKRMHMVEIWGYRLAEKPTEKAYRSSYRAAYHGAMVHDASYYQHFQLDGPEAHLNRVLAKICDPAAILPSSKRYSNGARECSTNLYDPSKPYPLGLIGPATFIWQPLSSTPSYEPILDKVAGGEARSPNRTILVRVHPAIARQAVEAVENAQEKVAIRKHDGEFVTFEVTGKQAVELVKSVLKPIKGINKATKDAWSMLDVEAGPGSVPEGMIFGLEVYDPRLSFPPRLGPSRSEASSGPLVPSSEVASSDIFWSVRSRHKIKTPTYRKADLDARRSKNLVPGTRLLPNAQDDRIPILVSKRTLSADGASTPLARPTSVLTLTIPSGWSMPFWTSLVHSHPRVAGLRERALASYEAGVSTFPQDWPSTRAFVEHEKRREVEDKGYWERRPPAKRPNYRKLGTDSPWTLDLPALLETAWSRQIQLDGRERQSADDTESDRDSAGHETFLVPHKIAAALEDDARRGRSGTTEQNTTEATRMDRLHATLLEDFVRYQQGERTEQSLLKNALVRVRIEPCCRGVPEDYGLVYDLEMEQVGAVRDKVAAARGTKRATATGEGEGAEDLCDPPTREQLIGRVTTGTFSLARGHGHGVGVVSLVRFLELVKRDASAPSSSRNLVLFRNRDSETYRAAVLRLMH